MRRFAALAAVASIVGISGCSDSTATKSGTLSLKLTDAPGDFKKAVVTIDQIYLQPSDASDAGRIVLRDDDVTVDLLTLANATADLVQGAVVPSGAYSQLRFVITGGYIEVENANGSTSIFASSPTYPGLPAGSSVTGTLQMPSFAQTGIKVNLPGGAVQITGEQTILLIDFDVARSFGQQAGQSGTWVMTPVLEATNFAVTGSILATLSKASGVTLPSINGTPVTLGGFRAVLATAAGSREEQALADANNDGVFEATFRFLAPGDYTVDFKAPSDSISFTTDPARPAAVSLASGQSATKAFALTSASK